MPTARQFVDRAAAEVGYVETPVNLTKYAAIAGHTNGLAWCATFLVAIAKLLGLPLPSTSASTRTMAAGFQKAGRWGKTPQVGAFVFYAWPLLGRIAHVGVVAEVHRDGSITAVEGNTDGKGSRTGGMVLRQLRRRSIAGYGYPAYDVAPVPVVAAVPTWFRRVLRRGASGADVVAVQHRLGTAADGQYGPRTQELVLRFQREHRLPANGVTGQATAIALEQAAHR